MGVITAILVGIAAGGLVLAIIYIAFLTVKKLKELIQRRKEKKAKQKVAFGKTGKILSENAREIIDNAPSMTMEELEKMCDENPYFVINYDPVTDEVSDFQMIKTDSTDEGVSKIVKEKEIVLFD